MFQLNVFYPNSPDAQFNMVYYLDIHMPLVQERLGANCKGYSVQSGLSGGAPGQPATFLTIASVNVASLDDYGKAMALHGAEIMGDVPNFTNIKPSIQISETKT